MKRSCLLHPRVFSGQEWAEGYYKRNAKNIERVGKRFAKLLKGTSGYRLLKEFPQMKSKYFWGSGLWGSQVYFDSTGRDADDMRAYVRNQLGNKKQISKEQATITQYLT